MLGQDFLHQVTAHQAIRGVAKLFQKCPAVGAAAQRERRQVQDGNPALGAILQRPGGLLGQLLAHHATEKGLRLLQRKAQVGAAQFAEASLGAPSGQGQQRVGAGGQHQVDLGGQMADQ